MAAAAVVVYYECRHWKGWGDAGEGRKGGDFLASAEDEKKNSLTGAPVPVRDRSGKGRKSVVSAAGDK